MTARAATAAAAAAPAAAVDYFLAFADRAGALFAPYLDPVESAFLRVAFRHFPRQSAAVADLLNSPAATSPHAPRLPLMNPFHVAVIVLAYFAMVFAGKVFMAPRKKFQAKTFSLLHNTFLTGLSAYMCFGIVAEALRRGYTLFGNGPDLTATGWPMAKMIWLFYFSKIFEFVDTLIMILKKNNHQISFLHVYHHSSIFIIWWLVTRAAPTGEAYFSAMLNSFIHVIMYGYYFLSAVGVKQVAFVKKYITMCQMTQFCMMMVQATYDIIDNFNRPDEADKGNLYPMHLTVILWVYMTSMLALFYNFFVQDAKRRRASQTLEKNEKKRQ